jgi:hypothetical protein
MTAAQPLTVEQARAVLFGRTCTRRTRELCDAAWAVWLASPECAATLAQPPAATLDPDVWCFEDALRCADTRTVMSAGRLRSRFGCTELEDRLPQGVDNFGNAY